MARKKKQEPLQHDWTMPEVLDVLSKENEGYRLLAAWYRDEPVFIDLMNHYGLSNQETLSAQMALREFREKMERYEGYDHDQLKDVVTYGFESTDTWLKQTKREADRYHETGEGHNARTAWHSICDWPDFESVGREVRILLFDGNEYHEATVTAETFSKVVGSYDGAYTWTYAATKPQPGLPKYNFSRDYRRLLAVTGCGMTLIGLARHKRIGAEDGEDFIVTIFVSQERTDQYTDRLFVKYGNAQMVATFGLDEKNLYDQLAEIDLRFLDPKEFE